MHYSRRKKAAMTARLKQIKDKKKREEEMNVLGIVGIDVTGNVESGEL